MIIENSILGEYQFVSYDEKLEDYLDSLGLPGKEYGAIIRTAEVRVVVREPPTYASGKKRRESLSGADKKWSVIHYDKGIRYFNSKFPKTFFVKTFNQPLLENSNLFDCFMIM